MMSADTLVNREWGEFRVDPIDLELLESVSGLARAECLERLCSYSPAEFATKWTEADLRTPAEIRRFYETTSDYVWELLTWNGTETYANYLRPLDELIQLWPPARHRAALDYGAGIGTVAIALARAGYVVTIADVPGLTLDFARARLDARGLEHNVIEIRDDVPPLPAGTWDVATTFDVLEHVPGPAAVVSRLVRCVKPAGGLVIRADFKTSENWPHHLLENQERFGDHRFELYLRGVGLKSVARHVYRRRTGLARLAAHARWAAWRATGLYVERLPR